MISVPTVKSARPLQVLGFSLLAMTCAGTQYWYPAIAPGLQKSLQLSDFQTAILVTTANSGSWLGFIGGFFHAHYGTRLTASLGATFISLTFFALAILSSNPLPASVSNFTLALVLTIILNSASYSLYSTCLCAAATMFAAEYRGRIVGLSAAFYGASAGVFGTIQAAFFPTLAHTTPLLLFVSATALCALAIIVAIFPGTETYAVEDVLNTTSTLSSLEDDKPSNPQSQQLLSHIHFAFQIAWTIVILLQLSAISNALNAPLVLKYICAVLVTSAVLSFSLLPLRSDYRVYAAYTTDEQPVEQVMPFRDVFFDPRYLLICYGCFTIVGGGGTALLSQAPHLLAAHMAPTDTLDREKAAIVIRTFVIIFSACNVTGRLLVGNIMDRGETHSQRTLWKYDIIIAVGLAAAVGLLSAGYLNVLFLYVSFAILGACQGTFFSISPALTTIWFGVQGFPRNFSVTGVFSLLGSVVLATLVPRLFSDKFGSWSLLTVKDNAEETANVCIGLLCTAPSFSILAAFAMMMFILGSRLRSFVQEEAEYSHL